MGTSPLDQIKARREQIAEEIAAVVIPVPRWSAPSMYLRIKPIPASFIDAQMTRVEKAGRRSKTEAGLNASAALIAEATVMVLVGDEDDGIGQAEVKLHNMREHLELDENADSVTTVRALCLTDGDVLKVANKILDHSGYGGERIEEALLGD